MNKIIKCRETIMSSDTNLDFDNTVQHETLNMLKKSIHDEHWDKFMTLFLNLKSEH